MKSAALVVALGCVAGSLACAQSPVGPDQFGMHSHGIARGAAWPKADFGYIRLWDTGTLWRDLEPNSGQWNFTVLDRYVELARERGTKVLLTLGQPPAWAAANPDAKSPYGPGASSPPRDLADWERYVRTLAQRYKGRIHSWEIWNEVDVAHFYSGNVEQLVELERSAAQVIKSVDPQSLVLTASVQSGAYRKFEAYLAAGGGRYSDVVSYHFYAPEAEPEVNVQRIAEVKRLMAKYGLQAKPLWNTEMGWLIPDADGGYPGQMRPIWKKWSRPGGADAAGYVARAVVLSIANGASHVFWYGWDHGAMALAEAKGTVPKPAAQAYGEVRRWLLGASVDRCDEQQGIWTCALKRPQATCWMVWSSRDRSLELPRQWPVTTWKALLGAQPLNLGSRVLVVGPQPVLVC